MKIKILYTIICFLIVTNAHAQHAIGSWHAYLSNHNVTRTEPAGSIVYALGNGSLFSYDTEDTSIQCYEKSNPLTDTNIAHIAYSNVNKTLIIVYSNANIDLLINGEDIYNLPDYMNKNMSHNKDINHIYVANEYAYLSTSFGIIVLNLKKKEIKNSFTLNKKINACAVDDNKIYAASSEGLFTGLLTDNLLDINNWKKVSDTQYQHLSIYNKELIGNILGNGIYSINKDNYSYSQLIGGYYSFMNVYDDKLIAGNDNSLCFFDNLNTFHYLDHNIGTAYLSYKNGFFWGGCYENGVIGLKYNVQSNKLEEKISSIIPNSPKRSYSFYMKFENERLLIAGGGHIGNRLNHVGTIMILEDQTWDFFQEDGIAEITKLQYKDITSVVQDPSDINHHFASSCGEGIYEFRDKKFVKQYSRHNSPLKEVNNPNIKPEYYDTFVRINGLVYDQNNNLWMLNCTSNYPIHILKPNGNWINLTYPEVTDISNFQNSMFDKRRWFWATSNRPEKPGVFCLNTKNTLEDSSDDQHKFIRNFINQDGAEVSPSRVFSIAEDKDGVIWVGTNIGPLILNNPSKFFDNNFYCTQIKIPRNDGTNLADFLLANEFINAIAIDGANRKWIGTEANGIYLLSADGMETIHHFTDENSPLLSNSIQSIAIHPRTGEIFIGTSKGLISYQSDATEAGENFSEDVYAYPNPVKPDYTGVITVTGLVRDTDVKITNVNGKLIYTGTSVGGQFTWNGRNQQGNRVPSGIYFVLAANAEGKEGVATKILFIK